MKNSLCLIIAYIIICLGGALACAALYMIYCDCTYLIAGTKIPLASQYFFLRGFFLASPVCAALAPYFMILYMIRHVEKFFLPLIIFVALSVVSFLLLIPSLLNLGSYYDTAFVPEKVSEQLTPGYFRSQDSSVFYYTSVHDDGTADGLQIATRGIESTLNAITVFERQPLQKFNSEPFADILIAQSMPTSPLLNVLFVKICEFVQQAFKILQTGYFNWICFCSMGLALITSAAFIRATYWRLLNVLLVCIGNCAIFVFNYLCHCTQSLASLGSFIHNLPFSSAVPYPVPFFGNVLIAIVFAVLGIIMFSVHRKVFEE